MICQIADLVTEIPAAGDLPARCRDYLWQENAEPDIVVEESKFRIHRYEPGTSEQVLAYMETAYQFYRELIRFDGMYLHSSAVAMDGRAYLFSGHCGAGKSTHTRLWQQCFGERAVVINDDKPALRKSNGIWYAYGTPWCGKDGINRNEKAALAGICFVKKAKQNSIRRLDQREAMQLILAQTIRKFDDVEMLDAMLSHLADLLEKIPVYELENLPQEAAAKLSYDTMYRGALEAGL